MTDQYSNEINPAVFKFQIASEQPVEGASLHIRRFGRHGFASYPLKWTRGFEYVLADSPDILQSGNLEYCISVTSGGNVYTFPGGTRNTPERWDFIQGTYWGIKILGAEESFVLLDVSRDRTDLVFPQWNRSRSYAVDFKNGSSSNETSLSLHMNVLEESGPPFGIQLHVAENLKPVASSLNTYSTVMLKGRSSKDSADAVSLTFVLADGRSYESAALQLKKDWQEIEVPLSAFHPAGALVLPGSYPLFLPKTRQAYSKEINNGLMLSALEFIQIIVHQAREAKETDVEIASVTLKK